MTELTAIDVLVEPDEAALARVFGERRLAFSGYAPTALFVQVDQHVIDFQAALPRSGSVGCQRLEMTRTGEASGHSWFCGLTAT